MAETVRIAHIPVPTTETAAVPERKDGRCKPAVDEALNIPGDRWTMLVLYEIGTGTERFNDTLQHAGMPPDRLAHCVFAVWRVGRSYVGASTATIHRASSMGLRRRADRSPPPSRRGRHRARDVHSRLRRAGRSLLPRTCEAGMPARPRRIISPIQLTSRELGPVGVSHAVRRIRDRAARVESGPVERVPAS